MPGAKQAMRRRLRDEGFHGDDEAVCARILEDPWFAGAKTVMAFMAMPSEPDLDPVIREILRQGKRLVLPRCEEGFRLSARIVEDPDLLIPGVFGIREPGPELPEADPADIDLILVPGMAFDGRGRRLGRGKGYYDRFLSDCPGRTMGICWHAAETVPVEEHDISVDAVVTEDAVIHCRTEGGAK